MSMCALHVLLSGASSAPSSGSVFMCAFHVPSAARLVVFSTPLTPAPLPRPALMRARTKVPGHQCFYSCFGPQDIKSEITSHQSGRMPRRHSAYGIPDGPSLLPFRLCLPTQTQSTHVRPRSLHSPVLPPHLLPPQILLTRGGHAVGALSQPHLWSSFTLPLVRPA